MESSPDQVDRLSIIAVRWSTRNRLRRIEAAPAAELQANAMSGKAGMEPKQGTGLRPRGFEKGQYGDIAPPHVQDPMTMVLRQNAIQADLIRWDDSRARFVLTGTGRNRITARSRSSGKILRFKMRDKNDGRAPFRKA
jgi:hypothetical protein